MNDAVEMLEQELGAELPDGFAELPDDQLRTLADLLQDAKARQKQELAEGVEESLNFVPRLMRGSVRKILFG